MFGIKVSKMSSVHECIRLCDMNGGVAGCTAVEFNSKSNSCKLIHMVVTGTYKIDEYAQMYIKTCRLHCAELCDQATVYDVDIRKAQFMVGLRHSKVPDA